MRVLVVSGVFAPNGFGATGVLAEQTAAGLRDHGHEVFVVTAAAARGREDRLTRWEVSSLPVLGVGVPAQQAEPSWARSTAEEILGVLRPDIVHAHSPRFLGLEPVRAAQGSGIATVLTDYGDRLWPSEILRAAGRVVVGGPGLRDEVVRAGVDPSRVSIVGHGAAPPSPAWRHVGHPGPLRLGFLGGMSPDAGYGVALAALRAMRRTDYELHVVDRATQRGVRSIREWDFKVPGLLRLLAGFPPRARDTFFGGIDVLLALPKSPSSACLSVREALLRGVWPIVSDCGSAREVVVDGKNGSIVDPESPDDVARAVAWALEHRELLAQARDAGTMGASVATTDDQVSALESLFAEVVGGQSARM